MSSQKNFTPAVVGVVGAGTMGRGIAQVAATHGARVLLYDVTEAALTQAQQSLAQVMKRLVEKGQQTAEAAKNILQRIETVTTLEKLAPAELIIEAVVEDLNVKQQCFQKLAKITTPECILASNTSSLSITAIAGVIPQPERVIGAHFFNPVPLMALVEIIPTVTTAPWCVERLQQTVKHWGKSAVLVQDTPGFIVNRVARPYYGEALRLLEEGIADAATIDWAMRELGGFRMGPFELMDLIGIDVNFKVTQSVFAAFFYDPRFKPSFLQQRMMEAGHLGKKSGRGFYDYREGAVRPEPQRDPKLGEKIFQRILAMLINEAADVVYLKVATTADVDLAMTAGVNYPKGLLRWADELGLEKILKQLESLQAHYGEDRYRPNPLLKELAKSGRKFY